MLDSQINFISAALADYSSLTCKDCIRVMFETHSINCKQLTNKSLYTRTRDKHF